MVELIFALVILLISALASSIIDRKHFSQIEKDEEALADVLIFNEKTPPPHSALTRQSLVTGNVVIAASYFKTFVAAIQGIFGGQMANYEITVEAARREALIRMRRAAQQQEAHMVINVRLETSSIAKQGPKQNVGAVEIFAYGTALSIKAPTA